MKNKDCFNCKYIKTWDYAGTLEEPADQGWECGHEDPQDDRNDIPDFSSDEDAAKYFATNCKYHEFETQCHQENPEDIYSDLVDSYA